jgi:hypothetical protein
MKKIALPVVILVLASLACNFGTVPKTSTPEPTDTLSPVTETQSGPTEPPLFGPGTAAPGTAQPGTTAQPATAQPGPSQPKTPQAAATQPAGTQPTANPTSNTESTPAAGLPGAPEVVSQVVFCTSVTDKTFDPVGLTTVFAPDVTIHAVVSVQNAPANSSFKINWLVTNTNGSSAPDSQMGTYSITAQGTQNIDFTFKGASPLPVGAYRVEIFMNDKLVRTAAFFIQTGG